ATLRPRGEARQQGGLALAVEAEAVDHRLVGVESEQARPRITALRARRYGPDLDEAETHTQQRVRHLGVLVETGRDADRVGKAQAEGAHRQSRVVFARLGSGASLSARKAKPWASSGSIARSKGRAKRSNSPIMRDEAKGRVRQVQ